MTTYVKGWEDGEAALTDCDDLRRRIVDAKRARNQAGTANAEARDAGQEPPYSEGDMMEFRAAVHMAAFRARAAGCNVDDLVGPNVGDRDSPL